MKKRFKFTVVFEGDLDMVPGWGHSEADWHKFAMAEMLRQSHYNTTATVIESTDTRDVFGGWVTNEAGWVEIPETEYPPTALANDAVIQIRTVNMPKGYYHPEWFRAAEVFTPERRNIVGARVTHYRLRKEDHDKIGKDEVDAVWDVTQKELEDDQLRRERPRFV